MYNIHQIKVSEKVYDFVNGPDGGHTNTANKYPEYNARLETQHKGARGFTADMFQYYTNVCQVADFITEGDKLEEVFKILNGFYYNEDTGTDDTFETFVSGFTMKNGTRKDGTPYSVRNMHSLSIGDIVEDKVSGSFHIVDDVGFFDITSLIIEAELVA